MGFVSQHLPRGTNKNVIIPYKNIMDSFQTKFTETNSRF